MELVREGRANPVFLRIISKLETQYEELNWKLLINWVDPDIRKISPKLDESTLEIMELCRDLNIWFEAIFEGLSKAENKSDYLKCLGNSNSSNKNIQYYFVYQLGYSLSLT